jgi:hypothetical protein
MKNKRDAYDDGWDVQPDPLVSVALAKSQSLIESGVWNMMSPDQERLVALLYEVNMLKDRKLKLSKDTQGCKKGNKPEDKGKFKRTPKPSKKKSDEDKWAWKKVPPQTGEPKNKRIPGFEKDHHWCDDHQAWAVHLLEDCELRQSRQQDDSASTVMPASGPSCPPTTASSWAYRWSVGGTRGFGSSSSSHRVSHLGSVLVLI